MTADEAPSVPLRVIDSHVHILSDDPSRYPSAPGRGVTPVGWPNGAAGTVDALNAAMDAAGVEGAVLVHFARYGYDNSYYADSASRFPGRFTCVGVVDPAASDALVQLEYWVRERGVRGLRFSTREATAWLDDTRTDALLTSASRLRVPVCVTGAEAHLVRLGALAKQFPELPFVLEHMGSAIREESAWLPEAGLAALLGLAALPNVYLKVSTRNLIPGARPAAVVEATLREITSRFGAQRLMWGSNYPASHDGSYGDMVQLGRTALPWLTRDERQWLLGGTAMQLWPELA